MNKKGFTLVELLTVIVIISLVLMIVFPAVSKILKQNSDELYESYEHMMVEYAKVSPLNTNNKIGLTALDNLEKVKAECTGYVTITRSSGTPVYKAFIKCGDKYKTTNYVDSLAG